MCFFHKFYGKQKTTIDYAEYWIINAIRLSPKHIKSIWLNPNISKYWWFGELKAQCLDTESDVTSKYVTNFFIIKRHYKREDFEINPDR